MRSSSVTDPRLRVARTRATELIQRQIDAGNEVYGFIALTGALEDVWANDTDRWIKYTVSMLNTVFESSLSAEEFMAARIVAQPSLNPKFAPDQTLIRRRSIKAQVNILRSLKERIDFFEVVTEPPEAKMLATKTQKRPSRRVFVVHGHDELLRTQVVSILHLLRLEPIVLSDQASGARGVMEKIEDYSDVWLAIVLMSDDDTGVSRKDWNKHAEQKDKEREVRGRARQNVVLELGYFMALVGRDNVCVIRRTVGPQEFEEPSDTAGIVYERCQSETDLKHAVTKYLVKVGEPLGIHIDTQKLFGH